MKKVLIILFILAITTFFMESKNDNKNQIVNQFAEEIKNPEYVLNGYFCDITTEDVPLICEDFEFQNEKNKKLAKNALDLINSVKECEFNSLKDEVILFLRFTNLDRKERILNYYSFSNYAMIESINNLSERLKEYSKKCL